jgi:hypothetical protein
LWDLVAYGEASAALATLKPFIRCKHLIGDEERERDEKWLIESIPEVVA